MLTFLVQGLHLENRESESPHKELGLQNQMYISPLFRSVLNTTINDLESEG